MLGGGDCMQRVVNELGGLAQRFHRLAEQLDVEIQLTQETWKDQRGEAFLREHLSPFKPDVAQLVACLHESRDMFEQLSRRLSDPSQSGR